MNLEWNKLRSWNGTIQNAFEALCCQLAAQERIENSKFIRKGTPDGGVECYWKCDDGDIAWQAKYFTTTPTSSQWGQVYSSLKQAIIKHPKLKKFIVCFPLDRFGSETDTHESFMVQWNENVSKWEEYASSLGLNIKFDYWGDHEIWLKLTTEENAGRLFYWFNQLYFSDNWFRENFENEIPTAGPRYQPKLNVELDISKIFEGLGRTSSFQNKLRLELGYMKKTYQDIGNHDDVHNSTDLLNALSNIIGNLEKSIESIENKIDVENIRESLDTALNIIYENTRILDESNDETDSIQREHPFKYFYNNIEKSLIKLKQFIISKQVELANNPFLLISGYAGVGKTHLLCDVAKKRIENNQPTLLIFNSKLNQEELWTQFLRYFGVTNHERDEFLGALNTSAEARDSRTIIIIDAINEGEAKRIWKKNLAGMITILSRYPRIGLVLSIRKSFERSVLPENILNEKIIQINHEGFGEQVFDAMEKFFEFYHIEIIDSPLLLTEFQNPQFLTLFCKVVQNTRLPSNQISIMTIFEKLLEKTNEKLSNSELLNYNSNQKIVQKSVNKIAELMFQEGKRWLPSTKVEEELDRILHREGYDNSMFYHLISEDIIFEDSFWIDRDTTEFRIQFSYERFSDYLIVNNWIEGKDLSQLEESIRASPLSRIFNSDEDCWNNQGIVEALSILIPNKFEKELFEIIPKIIEFSSVRSAFVESLKWRKHNSFSETIFDFIKSHVLRFIDTYDAFWEVVIQVSGTPEHPLNAFWLHKILFEKEMSKRDSWWSSQIHKSYSETNSVYHLINWVWRSKNQKYLNESSIELLGITLCWFLTSSNRFLRDRSTKALVALLTNHVDIFQKILQRFQNVNDPYVLERIFAVGYGCVTRSKDDENIKKLAQETYHIIFENSSPPSHILIRDYARGIIELASHRNLDISIDVQKILPPYGSQWPEIPTPEEIAQYDNYSKDMTREETSQLSIHTSVMDNDFARYVLGTNSESFQWTSERISNNMPIMKEIYDFFDSLDFIQNYIWENSSLYIINKKEFLEMNETRQRQYVGKELEKKTIENILEEYLVDFKNCLSSKQLKVCEEKLLPYLEKSKQRGFADFDISLLQRWILKKVFDLGWTVKKFGKFDRSISETYSGRNSNKAERIGKKYQWIAYHEILARVADNFEMKDDQHTNPVGIYDGTWQISYVRDIDPTVIIEEVKINPPDKKLWWHKKHYTWEENSNEEWVQNVNDLPNFKEFIEIKDNDDNPWLNLDSNYDIEQEIPPEQEAFHPPKRSMWFHLRSYFVQDSKFDKFWNELTEKDFFNNWMPNAHPGSFYKLFVGEYPWASSFFNLNTYYYGHDGWSNGGWGRGDHEKLSKKVLSTTEHITMERGFDCSINGTFQITLPIDELINELELDWCGKEGYFFLGEKIITFDPSIQEGLPDALLIDKDELVKYLKNKGYRIFWTIIGEKTVFGGELHEPSVSGGLKINAVYTLNDNNEIVGIERPKFKIYPTRN